MPITLWSFQSFPNCDSWFFGLKVGHCADLNCKAESWAKRCSVTDSTQHDNPPLEGGRDHTSARISTNPINPLCSACIWLRWFPRRRKQLYRWYSTCFWMAGHCNYSRISWCLKPVVLSLEINKPKIFVSRFSRPFWRKNAFFCCLSPNFNPILVGGSTTLKISEKYLSLFRSFAKCQHDSGSRRVDCQLPHRWGNPEISSAQLAI